MIVEKVKDIRIATMHDVTYSLLFLFVMLMFLSISWTWMALLLICITHILIDKYRIAAKLN